MWIRLLKCPTSLSWTPPHIVRDRTGRCAAVDQSRAQRVVPGQWTEESAAGNKAFDREICRSKSRFRAVRMIFNANIGNPQFRLTIGTPGAFLHHRSGKSGLSLWSSGGCLLWCRPGVVQVCGFWPCCWHAVLVVSVPSPSHGTHPGRCRSYQRSWERSFGTQWFASPARRWNRDW